MRYFTMIMLFSLLSIGSVARADICDILWLSKAHSQQVREQIRQGADVNQICNGFEDRPLHLALIHGLNPSIVYMLLNNCASIYLPNKSGQTPVNIIEERHHFAMQGDIEVSKLLDSQEVTPQEYSQMRKTLSEVSLMRDTINRMLLGTRPTNCPDK